MGDLGSMVYGLLSLIPKVTYVLATCFLGILDILQWLVRKFAGLDVYYIDVNTGVAGSGQVVAGAGSGEAQTGDIVYNFIKGILFGEYPALTNVFVGLIILGVILLFLTTIIALIRQEYNYSEQKNKNIIGSAFKSVFMFGVIPIVVLFGVYLANIVLVAVDKATSYSSSSSTVLNANLIEPYKVTYGNNVLSSETTAKDYTSYVGYNVFGNIGSGDGYLRFGTTTTTFSGAIFKASAYGCNRVRLTEGQEITLNDGTTKVMGFGGMLQGGYATNFSGLFTDSGSQPNDAIANYIDVAFSDAVYVKKQYATQLDYSQQYVKDYNNPTWNPLGAMQSDTHDFLNRFNPELVWYYYDLWQYNFIVAFGVAVTMAVIFVNIILGLGKRIVELIALFLMLPPIIGIQPLDGGGAFKKWKESFISKTLMAYGAIAGMNIFFLLLPYLGTIRMFSIPLLDNIVATLFMLIGAVLTKDLIKTVSSFAGGENAVDAGDGVGKELGSTLAKGGTLTAAAAAVPIATALKVGKLGFKGAKLAGGSVKQQATAGKRRDQAEIEYRSQKGIELGRAEIERNAQIEKIKQSREQYANEAEANLTVQEKANLEKDKVRRGLSDADFAQYKSNFLYKKADDRMTAEIDATRKTFNDKKATINYDLTNNLPQKSDYQFHGTKGLGKNIKRGLKYGISELAAPTMASVGTGWKEGYGAVMSNSFSKSHKEAGGFEAYKVGISGQSIEQNLKAKEKAKHQKDMLEDMEIKARWEQAEAAKKAAEEAKKKDGTP